MQKEWDLRKRTMAFAVAVFRFCRTLPDVAEGWDVYRQLRRSASSVAANYRAAKRASSDPLFLSKLAIAVEEADEAGFWLEFLVAIELVSAGEAEALFEESQELVKILTASRKTAEARIAKGGPAQPTRA
jgi:four helix bundle protein